MDKDITFRIRTYDGKELEISCDSHAELYKIMREKGYGVLDYTIKEEVYHGK